MDIVFVSQHQESFGNLNVFVTNVPYIQNISTIKNINENMDIVVCAQMTHPYYYRSVDEHFQIHNINKPWIQISWDTELPKTKNYLIFNYWATNMLNYMYETLAQDKYQSAVTNKREFLYSCLNNISKAHRLGILIRLFYSDYHARCLTSISKTTGTGTSGRLTQADVVGDVKKFSSKFDEQQIINFYNTLPRLCSQETPAHKVPFWIHDAYNNSYLNIVTEHDFESKFISEKSIKPFLTEQMAIFVSGPGNTQLLRESGIDIFDDIIDHDYYDHELNPMTRLDKVHELLNKMSIWDWENVYQQTRDRRKANRDFLLSHGLLTKFKQKLTTRVNELINF
jgi:hypothetical protein